MKKWENDRNNEPGKFRSACDILENFKGDQEISLSKSQEETDQKEVWKIHGYS